MNKDHLTRRQKANVELAREWYTSMKAGIGTPLNHVPYIRELLATARLDAAILDTTGQRTAAEIERELDTAYTRGEQMRLEAWQEHERAQNTWAKP